MPVPPADTLSDLKTEIRRVDPKSLALLEKNARYMTQAQLQRLIDNLKKDGALTSVPLCAPMADGRLEVLSGNHRVQAAIGAGLAEIDVMVILTPIDQARRVAIQLAHNAVTGQDDPSILRELYLGLELDGKAYSGLNDDFFKGLTQIDIAGMGIGSVKYEDLHLSFLQAEKAVFLALVADIEKKGAKKATRLVGDLADFSAVFETVVAIKHRSEVFNSAIALRMMAELAMERLVQLEAEDEAKNGGQA